MMRMQDLTQGSIPQHFVRLAAPLILGNILQQLYNTIDALVIGRYAGSLEFAAIGVAGSVMNLFIFAVVGACAGLSVLFAQQYGAENYSNFRQQHFLCLAVGLPVVILFSLIGILVIPAVLKLIQTPENLLSYAEHYLIIVFAGLPATYLYNLFSAMLRAVGNTRVALWALALATASNLILDLWLIVGLGLGIQGAAIATVLAQIFSAVLCITYLYTALPQLRFHPDDCAMNHELLVRMAYMAIATSLHNSGLYLGKLAVQGAVNTGGTELISAYTATMRIEGFTNSFGDSGAAATAVLVAQNIGRKKTERVKQIYRYSFKILAAAGLICSAVLYFTAGGATALLIGQASGASYHSAVSYLHLIALFYVFCFTGNTFAGYFDGIGKAIIPLVGAVSHITLRAVLSWLFIGQFGLNAVAIATGIGWIFVNVGWYLLIGMYSRELS